jgi:hypothetical protein
MGRRIAILFHEADRGLDLRGYSVSRLSQVWREDGHEIVPLYGTAEFVPADIVIVHVDLSVVPDEYLAFASRYPASVNGRVKDIRKSTFSRDLLLRPGDDWDGPVIIKSDRNYAGGPEAHKGIPRLDGRGTAPPFASPAQYRVFASLGEVPQPVFDSADFVVQKFVPEMEDGLFHMRMYQFFGDWGDCTRLGANDPIVKVDTLVTKAMVPVHPEIVALRHAMGFDFGKFDYVMAGDRPILLDVNKTTGGRVAGRRLSSANADMRARRARGLYALFPAAPQPR